jgi:hypothetical protein
MRAQATHRLEVRLGLRPSHDDLEPFSIGRIGENALNPGATLRCLSGPLAQLVEQGTLNPKVAGSIPARPTPRGSPARFAGRDDFRAFELESRSLVADAG